MKKNFKKSVAFVGTMALVAGMIMGNNSVKAEDEEQSNGAEKVVAFEYDATAKTAGEDMSEYALNSDSTAEDSYYYNTTSGTGIFKASITGEAYKHVEWSSDEYTLPDGSTSIVPAIGASKSNNWTEKADAEFTFSTTGYENLSISLEVGATKKGPKNFLLYYLSDSEKVFIGTFSLSENKTVEKHTFTLPARMADQESVTVYLGLADTKAMSGSELSVNPTGGEFSVNNVVVLGTKKVEETTSSEEITTGQEQVTSSEQATSTENADKSSQIASKVQKAQVKIAKVAAKKKISKKLKISLKNKIAGATGYSVRVYKSLKAAKLNKANSAFSKFTVKKNLKTIVVTSAKLANKTTMFVRVRAYVKIKGKNIYSNKWSNIVKVKVK